MAASILEECMVRSVVDLSTLNIYERAIAAYLNIAFYYGDDKHWKWLQPLSKELANLPRQFYTSLDNGSETLLVDNNTLHKKHLRNNLIVAFSPDSSEDYYDSTLIPVHHIGQILYFEDVADKIVTDPIWSDELREAIYKLRLRRDFINAIEMSPYLIKLRT